MLIHQIQSSGGTVSEGVNINDRTIGGERLSGTCHSGIKLGSDGVLSTIQADGGFSQVTGEWMLAGTPSDFYVQHTIIVGTLEVEPGPGFNQLNTDRIYDNQRATAGVKLTTVFFEIADDAVGTNILDTATMNFASEQGTLQP